MCRSLFVWCKVPSPPLESVTPHIHVRMFFVFMLYVRRVGMVSDAMVRRYWLNKPAKWDSAKRLCSQLAPSRAELNPPETGGNDYQWMACNPFAFTSPSPTSLFSHSVCPRLPQTSRQLWSCRNQWHDGYLFVTHQPTNTNQPTNEPTNQPGIIAVGPTYTRYSNHTRWIASISWTRTSPGGSPSAVFTSASPISGVLFARVLKAATPSTEFSLSFASNSVLDGSSSFARGSRTGMTFPYRIQGIQRRSQARYG